MKWNMNNTGFNTFEKGKRYELVVVGAKDGYSSQKSTPQLTMVFETPDLQDAHDKVLYNTEKAAYRMIEWAKAMGFPCEGDVDLDPEEMIGIHITAKAGTRKDDSGKEYIDWVEPLPVVRGAPKAAASVPPPAPAAEAQPQRAPASSDEVPF